MLGINLGLPMIQRGASGTTLPTGSRGAAIAFSNNTNAATCTLPAGSAVGDFVVLYWGHAWQAGGTNWHGAWTSRNNLVGSNYNGQVMTGPLDATDVARGTLGITFVGSGYGFVQIVVYAGSRTFRDIGASRFGTGAASRTVTTGSSVATGDDLFLFGSAWTATDATSTSLPTLLLHDPHANGSGVCVYGTAGSNGAQSGTVNYAGSPGADYQALVAIAP